MWVLFFDFFFENVIVWRLNVMEDTRVKTEDMFGSNVDLLILVAMLVAIVMIIGLIYMIYRYILNKKLQEKYPKLTRSQRFFIHTTVEPMVERIKNCLSVQLKLKGVDFNYEFVQQSKKHLVVHVPYSHENVSNDHVGTRLVIFDSDKEHEFCYEGKNHDTSFMSDENLARLFIWNKKEFSQWLNSFSLFYCLIPYFFIHIIVILYKFSYISIFWKEKFSFFYWVIV